VQQERDPGGTFSWQVRVYYEDVDIGGVVYYANYLRYFERARSEWLRGLGVNHERLAAVEGIGFAAARIQAACVRHRDMRPQPIPDIVVTRLAA